jgi:hypothetical protein
MAGILCLHQSEKISVKIRLDTATRHTYTLTSEGTKLTAERNKTYICKF